MERHLDKELQELKTDILRMGGLVENAIGASVEALKQLDRAAAERSSALIRQLTSWSLALMRRAWICLPCISLWL